MNEKLETFSVNIAVIEGKDFAWANMDSLVIIRVHKQKKHTTTKYCSNNPYFNEYFVFEFTADFDKFRDFIIDIRVLQPCTLRKRKKILGFITMDIGTVWEQPDHQFFNKWAVLCAVPKYNTRKEIKCGRGYLKVNIQVLSRGQIPKLPANLNRDNTVEGNLLLPEGFHNIRQKACYIFDIYNVEYHKASSLSCFKESKCYVEIKFAGLKIKTSTSRYSHNSRVIFDERLSLVDFFPPMCQRIKVNLHYFDKLKKSVVAVRNINMHGISNGKENGFLPTFGPALLHFYVNDNMEGYLGSVLMGVTTVLYSMINKIIVPKRVTHAPHSSDEICFDNEQVCLFATIFEACDIPKVYNIKGIYFKITIGSHGTYSNLSDGTTDHPSHTTRTFYTIGTNNYCYLPINQIKPCMSLCFEVPNFLKRMYHSNILMKIAFNIKLKIDEIESISRTQDFSNLSDELEKYLSDCTKYIEDACTKYLEWTKNYTQVFTILDRERKKLCISEIKDIAVNANSLYCPTAKRKSFLNILNVFKRIHILIRDAQDSWPDIYIWMYCEKKKIAFYQILTRDVLYSVDDNEKGQICGEVKTIFLQSLQPKRQIANPNIPAKAKCRMSMMMWLGSQKHLQNCFQIIPEGYSYETDEYSVFPRYLEVNTSYMFHCRGHIFQGRFLPGSDTSGLADPFAEVMFSRQKTVTSKVVHRNLNPVWDQTLECYNVVIHGTKDFIKKHPPFVLVEINDGDSCCKRELIGRALLRPKIKFIEDPYTSPEFPPLLEWFSVYNKSGETGEILSAFELLQVGEPNNEEKRLKSNVINTIPAIIKPNLVEFKIEILFWGVRSLKTAEMLQINKPRITIAIGDIILHSNTISNARHNSNFDPPVKSIIAKLPLQEKYNPSLTIKLYDNRNFGIFVFGGIHIAAVSKFLYLPLTKTARDALSQCTLTSQEKRVIDSNKLAVEIKVPNNQVSLNPKTCFGFTCARKKTTEPVKETVVINMEENKVADELDRDWWTKFFDSMKLQDKKSSLLVPKIKKHLLRIYPRELELQPEFEGFTDTLNQFPLYKGKRSFDDYLEDLNVNGVFKGALKIYRWPPENKFEEFVTETGSPLQDGYFQNYPSNKPLKYVVRCYCVRYLNLRPMDLSGRCDPFLIVKLNNHVINDKKHRFNSRQLTTILIGRCFEFEGVFPVDHELIIQVWDWDKLSANDFIGETKIDLENRFYSKHRGTCGIPEWYQESGYCWWRDQYKPDEILESLCANCNMESPFYTATSVQVGTKLFMNENFTPTSDLRFNKQVLALTALRRWSEVPIHGCALVPEHVETRSLYNYKFPGIQQGKLQLFVEMFPIDYRPLPKQLDIIPVQPTNYELRVIIWNTQDVKRAERDFITGKKKTDIFVKGWLVNPNQTQRTDVHYRSLSGEGYFNWRFIFNFMYLPTHNKMIVNKKHAISGNIEEVKMPCVLTLQIWDNDIFTPNDFIGSTSLLLSDLPIGAANAKLCNLKLMRQANTNLFKIKRTKGWWPVIAMEKKTHKDIVTGKIQIEMELFDEKQALRNPAGLGRLDPQALPDPKRPETAFAAFKHPLTALNHFLFKENKKKCCILLTILFIAFCAIVTIISFPKFGVKKLLKA